MIKVKKALWLPSQKFYCSFSKCGGSASELLLLKQLLVSFCYTVCGTWMKLLKYSRRTLPNHKRFHMNSDQNISFNFSLFIPGNPVLIRIRATKKLGKLLKKNSVRLVYLSGIQGLFFFFFLITRKTSMYTLLNKILIFKFQGEIIL